MGTGIEDLLSSQTTLLPIVKQQIAKTRSREVSVELLLRGNRWQAQRNRVPHRATVEQSIC